MATLRWRLEGKWLKNCNCAPGCPCEFWAPPTHGGCDGMFAMKVDRGYFGKTKMDGVKFGVVLRFPGPLHEGKGVAVPFIDDKTSQAQRAACVELLSGRAGGAWFQVFHSLLSTLHPPHIAPVRFEHDMKKRRGRVIVPGLLETVTEPIRNLATGEVHTVQVHLPGGIEYKRAETALARVVKATGPVSYDWSNGHSSLAHVVQTEHGLVR